LGCYQRRKNSQWLSQSISYQHGMKMKALELGSRSLPLIVCYVLLLFGSSLLNISIDKAQLLIPGNRTITSTNDFLKNHLLNEIERLGALQNQGLPMRLATDISKEGPTFLTKRAEQFHTVKELLESGLFRKDSCTGNLSIIVVVEREEEIIDVLLSEEESVRTKASKGKGKVKKEPKIKTELKIKKEPKSEIKIKKELEIKSEVFTPVWKRGFSQLSPETPVADDIDEEGEDLSPLINGLQSRHN
jgi:hypothetical protein